MGLFSLFNRKIPTAPAGEQVSLSAPATVDPSDKLGDPLATLRPETIRGDFRRRINRGELALPTWALHEALRLLPLLGNHARSWCAAIGGLDWTIKTVDIEGRENEAKRHAKTLREAYERLNVTRAVKHLARGNLYGYSVLVRETLEPLNWWNVARDGLFGEWKYNPDLRITDGKNGRLEPMDARKFIVRFVEDDCLLAYLRIYIRATSAEDYWDDNLEKESKRQVVIIPGTLDAKSAQTFKAAALDIMMGRSGTLAGGTGDKQTSVTFPPESRGLPYYENRLKRLDDEACKALFGASLIANSAPDSGTLAGNAHSDTSTKRITDAAAEISSVFQEQFDRVVLEEAGLIKPGEPALAYFVLAPKEQADPDKEIEWTGKLSQSGWQRDEEELRERTGMKLTPTPHQTGAFPGLGNSRLVNRAAESVGVPDSWLGPVRKLLDDIAAAAPEEITPEYIERTLAEVKARLPEVFGEMDLDAFADVLEAGMGAAAVEGVRDAIRKRAKA